MAVRRTLIAFACMCAPALAFAQTKPAPDPSGLTVKGPAQPGDARHVVVPKSSQEQAGDRGQRAHTNVGIVARTGPRQSPLPK